MSDPAKPSHERALARSSARLAAVQALYQMGATGVGLDTVIPEFNTYRFNQRDSLGEGTEDAVTCRPDEAFFEDLLRGVVSQQDRIDQLVRGHLPEGWRLSRLDSTLLAILRAGTYELIARDDVPFKVVINEYVEVTHAFFDGDEPGLTNGILDRLAHELRRNPLNKQDAN